MSTSRRRTRNVTVIGGGLVGLSTAINIQENVPDVHVEVVDDVGYTAMTTLMGSFKAIKGFGASSPTSAKSENTTDKHFNNTGYPADDEGCSPMVDIVKDGPDIGAASLSIPELSFTRSSRNSWSSDDVIWLPESVPGLDDTTGRGGHYRFWAVLTWYHLYEMAQRESSRKTGVRLLSNYVLGQWKANQVSDWWKDLVPDYRPLHNEFQEQSTSGLGNSRSFTTAVINAPRYLQYLSERFVSCGGRLRRGHISSLNELSGPCDLLVNCSGINIDELSGGAELPAVQSLKLQPTTSIHALNSNQRCQFEDICLETDTITHGGRSLPIVHNYGYDQDHLVTLHWGCAQEAARLASDTLAGRFIGLASKL